MADEASDTRVQPKGSSATVYGSLAGGIFGGTCWLYPMTLIAEDWFLIPVVLVVTITLFVLTSQWSLRGRFPYYQNAIAAVIGVTILNLVLVNWRWDQWILAYRQSAWYQPSGEMSLTAVNLLILAICVFIVVALLATRPRLPT